MQEAQVRLRYIGNRKLGHVRYVGDGIHCFLEYPESCDVEVSQEKAEQLLYDFPGEWVRPGIKYPPKPKIQGEDAFISQIKGDMHITKVELVRWAKENLNMDLSMRLKKSEMRDRILEA